MLKIENAGAGVAQITRVELQVTGWSAAAHVLFPGVLRSGASGDVRAEFSTPPPSPSDTWGGPPRTPELEPGTDINVRVHYRGAGGRDFQVAFGWIRPTGSEARWRLSLNKEIGHTILPGDPYEYA